MDVFPRSGFLSHSDPVVKDALILREPAEARGRYGTHRHRADEEGMVHTTTGKRAILPHKHKPQLLNSKCENSPWEVSVYQLFGNPDDSTAEDKLNRLKCTFQRVALTTDTHLGTQQVKNGSVKLNGRMKRSRSKLASWPWAVSTGEEIHQIFILL